MSVSDANCITVQTIEQETADEDFDNFIVNVINTIPKIYALAYPQWTSTHINI